MEGVIAKAGEKSSAQPKAATIEVRVRDLAQLFNSMDPSPFHEKDLDNGAEEWIVSSAQELRERDLPLRLVVHVEKKIGLKDAEVVVARAVYAFFQRQAELKGRELRQLLRVGRKSLLIGMTAVTCGVLAGDLAVNIMKNQDSLAQIIREGLLIGGWVAMWRPIEIFLYDWWPIRDRRRLYHRLQNMDVVVRYCGERCEHELALNFTESVSTRAPHHPVSPP
jgi:hypothetical protein